MTAVTRETQIVTFRNALRDGLVLRECPAHLVDIIVPGVKVVHTADVEDNTDEQLSAYAEYYAGQIVYSAMIMMAFGGKDPESTELADEIVTLSDVQISDRIPNEFVEHAVQSRANIALGRAGRLISDGTNFAYENDVSVPAGATIH